MRIVLFANSGGGLIHFRKEVMLELIKEGHTITIVIPEDEFIDEIKQLQCDVKIVNFNRRSKSIVENINLIISYYKIIKLIKPDVVLTYTIKPNIFGGFLSRISKIPYIANITGMGSSIHSGGLLEKLIVLLYKISLSSANVIFVQNQNIFNYFTEKIITDKSEKNIIKLLPGSGVNLEYFNVLEYPHNKPVNYLYIGRIMKDKGILELLEAIKIIKDRNLEANFHFVGPISPELSDVMTDNIHSKDVIYHGKQKDVRSFIRMAHVIIHPSHHEGLSNVLLEAASSGRPVIASNIPGCKETFEDGITGLSFEVKNVEDLVNKIEKFYCLSEKEKKEMGLLGREKVKKEFSRDIIIQEYLSAIREIEEN